MSLTNHRYSFVSQQEGFYNQNRHIFGLMKGAVLEQVYAVWDCLEQGWFGEAPMLVKTSAGILSVHVKSDEKIAIGWNDFSLSEKPIWFDETQREEIKGLNWVEDLEWRVYEDASPVRNERIEKILFHPASGQWGVGIGLKCTSGECLWLYDGGDVISAKIESMDNPP